ncbi:MAG: phosphoglucosamine mutase [Oscillospiraceae bacterium]|nr:phosphoglucosamine mutase [Oscillospiraceae bacterium]
MEERMFGTDGVRGVANTELTAQLAYNIGYAGARVLTGSSLKKSKFLIGTDTRISCDMLEAAIIAGICSTGADAVSAGVVPTPAVAYLTSLYGADAGIVISASHNSFEFNGIKFFDRRGYKLPDAVEDEIEDMIRKGPRAEYGYEPPTGGNVGRHSTVASAAKDYASHLVSYAKCDLSGMRIALDCANGAASAIAPRLFESLGATVFPIHCSPDGVNINDRCGSTHIDAIRSHTVACGADIGFAFDGDADRVLAVDEKGGLLSGDTIMALLAIDMHERGQLPKETVVATVMSNLGLEIAVKKRGITLVRTSVGDRYVLEEMLKNGFALGGENSGHIICLDENTTGDGISAALRLLKTLMNKGGGKRETREPVSALASVVKDVPQIIRNAKVSNVKKNTYLDDPVIRERCEKIETLFRGEGRVIIRPSGTEPFIRVMIESEDKELIETEAEGLAKLIENRLG